MQTKAPIIVGISGASGAIYGIRTLEILRELGIETHLIISKAAQLTITQETDYSFDNIRAMATHSHTPNDIAAPIASGSVPTTGMIIAPCSMKCLAEIANGLGGNLISRAADVVLKERRRLVLLARETPLTLTHLDNMRQITLMGGIIAPPVPAMYNQPESIDALVTHSIGRALDLFDIDTRNVKRWQGMSSNDMKKNTST